MPGDDEKPKFMNDTLNSDEEEKEPLLASYNSSPSPSPEPQFESESESEPLDARVTQPPQVSRLKRTSLLIFFAVLCWLTYSNVLHSKRKPKIIHASRSVMNLVHSSTLADVKNFTKKLFASKKKKDIPRITSSALKQVLSLLKLSKTVG